MFEPPILDQLMGVGALLLGFAGALPTTMNRLKDCVLSR